MNDFTKTLSSLVDEYWTNSGVTNKTADSIIEQLISLEYTEREAVSLADLLIESAGRVYAMELADHEQARYAAITKTRLLRHERVVEQLT